MKDEGISTLSSMLMIQFKDKWKHLNQVIDKVPEKKFHVGEKKWRFSWVLFHIIETADFYSRNTPDTMKWGDKAGFDWEKSSKQEIIEKKLTITKNMLREYSKEIELRIEQFLKDVSDEELLKKDDFHWFDSILGKLVYMLRHNAFHVGELARILRGWDGERFKW